MYNVILPFSTFFGSKCCLLNCSRWNWLWLCQNFWASPSGFKAIMINYSESVFLAQVRSDEKKTKSLWKEENWPKKGKLVIWLDNSWRIYIETGDKLRWKVTLKLSSYNYNIIGRHHKNRKIRRRNARWIMT